MSLLHLLILKFLIQENSLVAVTMASSGYLQAAAILLVVQLLCLSVADADPESGTVIPAESTYFQRLSFISPLSACPKFYSDYSNPVIGQRDQVSADVCCLHL